MNSNSFDEITEEIVVRWQEMVDLLAKLLLVPAALIMRTENEFMEVFVSSNSDDNPYHVGNKEEWYGLYCETVIKNQSKLLVSNALNDKVWDKNPDIKLGMISYLGLPINFPDDTPFGTICILDSKENYFSSDYEKLMLQLKRVIELDLALLQSNKKLLKLNIERSLFLSILAHDIKSPLAAISGLSHLLIKNIHQYDNEKIEFFAQNINDAASSTNNLLYDLLLLSTSQYGKLSFEPQEIEFKDICVQTIAYLDNEAKKKQITIAIYNPDDIILFADENMLKTVFRSLVSNAIKFSNPKGNIVITAEKTTFNVVITVSDNGEGIEEEVQKKLFDVSQRISNIGITEEQGVGLGLILCKEFIEKHDGKIWVESKVGIGSNFKFSLPNSY